MASIHLLPREGYLRSTIVAVKTLERTLKLSFYFEKTKIRNLRRKSDSFFSPEAQETVHGGGAGFRQSYLSGGSQVLGYFVGEYVQFVLVIIGHAESVHYLFDGICLTRRFETSDDSFQPFPAFP